MTSIREKNHIKKPVNSHLAVVVINYNGWVDTFECLQSIFASSLVPAVVLVDQNSKENLLSKVTDLYPEVECIRLQENNGYASGVNAGFRWAKTRGYEFVASMNNDTTVAKDTFRALMDAAQQDTLVTPVIYEHQRPDVLWYGGGRINRFTGGSNHLMLGQRKEIHSDFFCSFASGCFWLLPTAVIDDVGYLDETFYMYGEDTDYCIRLQKNGFRIKVVAKARIWHKISRTTGASTSPFQNYYLSRNRLALVERHKDYYYTTAKLITLFGRFTRAFKYLLRRNPSYRAIAEGVFDYFRGVTERNERYVI